MKRLIVLLVMSGIAKMQIEFYDATGGRTDYYEYKDMTADWVLHSITATAPTGTVDVHMYLGIGTSGIGRNTLFDNVSLVPEPMTIGLLGLGALFLRRR